MVWDYSPSHSTRSEQSARAISQNLHSGALGTLRAAVSDNILRTNSSTRLTNASSTLAAGISYSTPSLYTSAPLKVVSRQRPPLALGNRNM